MEEATFRVPSFFISGEISSEIWYKDSNTEIQTYAIWGPPISRKKINSSKPSVLVDLLMMIAFIITLGETM